MNQEDGYPPKEEGCIQTGHGTVLGFKDDDAMTKAMDKLGYEDISDLETMSESEIMGLTYVKTLADNKFATLSVPMKQKKLLLHVLW